jgi:hypothetical protein
MNESKFDPGINLPTSKNHCMQKKSDQGEQRKKFIQSFAELKASVHKNAKAPITDRISGSPSSQQAVTENLPTPVWLYATPPYDLASPINNQYANHPAVDAENRILPYSKATSRANKENGMIYLSSIIGRSGGIFYPADDPDFGGFSTSICAYFIHTIYFPEDITLGFQTTAKVRVHFQLPDESLGKPVYELGSPGADGRNDADGWAFVEVNGGGDPFGHPGEVSSQAHTFLSKTKIGQGEISGIYEEDFHVDIDLADFKPEMTYVQVLIGIHLDAISNRSYNPEPDIPNRISLTEGAIIDFRDGSATEPLILPAGFGETQPKVGPGGIHVRSIRVTLTDVMDSARIVSSPVNGVSQQVEMV